MNTMFADVKTHFFGTPEERWSAAGAEFVDRTVNGETLSIPMHDVEITDFDETSVEPLWSDGHEIGTLHSFQVEINHNNPRNAYFWEVYEAHNEDPNISVSDRAALTTEIDGYSYKRAQKLALEKRLSTLQIGTEHSGAIDAPWYSPKQIKGIYDAAMTSLYMSVMKTAQEEELVADKIYRYVLGYRPDEYAIGDSQAAITTPARIVYAEELGGSKTPAIDIKAACCYDKTSLARAALWLAKEVTIGPIVLGDMLLHDEMERLAKTPSLNPRLQIGATLGKISVLLAGELGKTMPMIDQNTAGQVLRHRDDGMSPDDGMSYWESIPHVNRREIDGTHFQVARTKGIRAQTDRIGRSVEVLKVTGKLTDLTAQEAEYIYHDGSLVAASAAGLMRQAS